METKDLINIIISIINTEPKKLAKKDDEKKIPTT